MIRYRSCQPPDAKLRVQLRELANARRRFGYRRLFCCYVNMASLPG
jgi:putative transposase